jgi:hypothetical protein
MRAEIHALVAEMENATRAVEAGVEYYMTDGFEKIKHAWEELPVNARHAGMAEAWTNFLIAHAAAVKKWQQQQHEHRLIYAKGVFAGLTPQHLRILKKMHSSQKAKELATSQSIRMEEGWLIRRITTKMAYYMGSMDSHSYYVLTDIGRVVIDEALKNDPQILERGEKAAEEEDNTKRLRY